MKDFFVNFLFKIKTLRLKRRQVSIYLVAVILLALSAMHIWLLSDLFFYDKQGGIHSTVEGYGDIPLHMTQVSKYAFSDSFNLDEPIYIDSKMKYHFLLNMIRGWILGLTQNLHFSMLFPLYILVFPIIFLTFFIYRRVLKSNWLSLTALVIFLLGSGTGNWSSFLNGSYRALINLTAVYPDQNVVFGPVLSMSLLHQNTFLLGTASFLFILWCLFKFEDNIRAWKYGIMAVVFIGLLPIMHMHSFIAIVLTLGIWMLFGFKKDKRMWLKRLVFVFSSGMLIALPQMYFFGLSKSNAVSNFFDFRLGWMIESGIGSAGFGSDVRSVFSLDYLNFTWINFGIILPLFIAFIFYFVYRYRSHIFSSKDKIAFFAFSAIGLFILVHLVQFQPWDYDNNKILVYFIFLCSPFLVWMVNDLPIKKNFRIGLLAILLIFSTLSGINDTIFRLNYTKENLPQIFDRDALSLAEYVKNNVSQEGVVLTGTTHLNPVSSLAGRQVLVGYTGWLWSRGIDYSEREKEIRSFYSAPDKESSLLKKYNISHILFDPSVEVDYGAKVSDFDKNFKKVFSAGKYLLYTVKLD